MVARHEDDAVRAGAREGVQRFDFARVRRQHALEPGERFGLRAPERGIVMDAFGRRQLEGVAVQNEVGGTRAFRVERVEKARELVRPAEVFGDAPPRRRRPGRRPCADRRRPRSAVASRRPAAKRPPPLCAACRSPAPRRFPAPLSRTPSPRELPAASAGPAPARYGVLAREKRTISSSLRVRIWRFAYAGCDQCTTGPWGRRRVTGLVGSIRCVRLISS